MGIQLIPNQGAYDLASFQALLVAGGRRRRPRPEAPRVFACGPFVLVLGRRLLSSRLLASATM